MSALPPVTARGAVAGVRGSSYVRCPRCGGRAVIRRDGIFQWRACSRTKRCGWDVFTHGDDPRDFRDEAAESPSKVAEHGGQT